MKKLLLLLSLTSSYLLNANDGVIVFMVLEWLNETSKVEQIEAELLALRQEVAEKRKKRLQKIEQLKSDLASCLEERGALSKCKEFRNALICMTSVEETKNFLDELEQKQENKNNS